MVAGGRGQLRWRATANGSSGGKVRSIWQLTAAANSIGGSSSCGCCGGGGCGGSGGGGGDGGRVEFDGPKLRKSSG